jgi:hypothetical protein
MKNWFLTFLLFPFAIFSQVVNTIVTNPTVSITDAIITDPSGNVFGSDYSGSSVYKIDPSGNATNFATGFDSPNGLAFVSNSNLYVADNTGNAVYILDNQGNFLDTIQITNPSGIIKMQNSDSLWLTTYNPSALYKLAPNNDLIQIHVGGSLNGPVGLCYDDNNQLFVGNFSNRAIYKVFDDTLIFHVQIPSGGFGSSLGFITYAQGGIWGTTFGTNRIYKADANIPDSVVFYIGSAQGNTDGAASQALFNQPNGIYSTPSGDTIYISDYGSGNLRVLTGDHLNDTEITDPDSDFEIIPNPSRGPFEIDLGKSSGESKIRIYNLFGQEVYKGESNGLDRMKIDPTNWKNGVYLIHRISNNSNNIKRLVISKR